eukprot:PhM_4_TR15514/c0_g1_i1/m.36779
MRVILLGDDVFAPRLHASTSKKDRKGRPTWELREDAPLNHGNQLQSLRAMLQLPDLNGGMHDMQLFRWDVIDDDDENGEKGELLPPNETPQELGLVSGCRVFVVCTNPSALSLPERTPERTPVVPSLALASNNLANEPLSPTTGLPLSNAFMLRQQQLPPFDPLQESVATRLRTAHSTMSGSPRGLAGAGLDGRTRRGSVPGGGGASAAVSAMLSTLSPRGASALGLSGNGSGGNTSPLNPMAPTSARQPYQGRIAFTTHPYGVESRSTPRMYMISPDAKTLVKNGADNWETSPVFMSDAISGGVVRVNLRFDCSRGDVLPHVMIGAMDTHDAMAALSGESSQDAAVDADSDVSGSPRSLPNCHHTYRKGWFFSVLEGTLYSIRKEVGGTTTPLPPVLPRRDYFYSKNGVVSLVLNMDEGRMQVEYNGADLGVSFGGITCPEVYLVLIVYSCGGRVEIVKT